MSSHLLMVPGPVPLDAEVVAELNRPAISHHDPRFLACFDECVQLLTSLFGVDGRVAILPGSGRLGLEALITSTVSPGDRTLHLVNGFFAGWLAEIARRAGAEVTVEESAWYSPLSPSRLAGQLSAARKRNRPYALVTAVHCETSTGLLNPVEELAAVCREEDVLFLVDAVSSLGCTPFDMRKRGIHLCGTASQKGLAAPMGLAAVAVDDEALYHIRSRSRPVHSFALDLQRWDAFFSATLPRPYPVVPSTHLVYALRAALRRIQSEGLANREARHAHIAAATRAGLRGLGLELYPESPSPTVSAFRVPDGIDAQRIVEQLLTRHGIQIATGMGPEVADRVIRVSHIDAQAKPELQLRVLEALDHLFAQLGYPSRFEAAHAAFTAAIDGPHPQV